MQHSQFFENIYKEHLRDVQYFAYSYLNDWEDAEGVAHDVFVKLWENLDRIDLEQAILPYLITLAKNTCLNKLKHNKIVDSYSLDYRRNTIETQAIMALAPDALYSNEVERIIAVSLNTLSPKIKETFVLSRFRGKSYKEIAEMQGISIKSVEYRIMEALKVLRTNLKDYVVILIAIIFLEN